MKKKRENFKNKCDNNIFQEHVKFAENNSKYRVH